MKIVGERNCIAVWTRTAMEMTEERQPSSRLGAAGVSAFRTELATAGDHLIQARFFALNNRAM